ncbi:LOW QUALITY PROTEIN: mitochondrial nicotinamide adenine dinucleotide transporter SLC25A52 [Dugong dugon]
MMDSEAHERGHGATTSKQDTPPHIENVGHMKHYLCGNYAAFNNIATTLPVPKVFFQQKLGIKSWDVVLQLIRDGFRNLYQGILPPLRQKTTTLAVMFGLYEDLSYLLYKHVNNPEFATQSVVVVFARTIEAISTPLEILQILLQDHRHHEKFTNTYQNFNILKCHVIGEHYRGMVPILFNNVLLFFFLQGPIKKYLPTAVTHSTYSVSDFICGSLLGTMLGFLFFQIKGKLHMQCQTGGEFQSFLKVFFSFFFFFIWLERDRDVTNLFRAANLNYLQSIISSIFNATYEFLLKVI